MRIFQNGWGAGSLAVLLTLAGTCWQANAQEHEDHTSLRERTQLFGDWRGTRTRLAQRGIIVDLQTTQFYQGITSGGPADAAGEWEYGGVGDAYITLVGDKFGWKGFTFAIHAETRFGTDINSELGLAPPNFRMLFPPDEPPVVAATGYYFIQQIRDGWAAAGGKFNFGDLVDLIYHTGNGVDQFMNASLVLPLNFGVPLGAYSIPGAALIKFKGEEVQGLVGVVDTKDYSTKFGVEDLFDRGASILGLWKFFHNIHGLPGYSSILGIYNTREFKSIDPSSYIIIPGQGLIIPEVRGSWAASYLVDQKLWVDPDNSKRNVGLLGWIGLADDNTNVIRAAGSITLKADGLIPGRERDSFGVGYFYTGLSGDFKELVGDAFSLLAQERVAFQDSQGFEAYYKFGVTPWLAMTADLQVIQPITVGLDTAVVAGVRTKVKF